MIQVGENRIIETLGKQKIHLLMFQMCHVLVLLMQLEVNKS